VKSTYSRAPFATKPLARAAGTGDWQLEVSCAAVFCCDRLWIAHCWRRHRHKLHGRHVVVPATNNEQRRRDD
jgi:hypothetical protein